jgi:uncharacterized protein (DUF427 family)
MAAKMRQVLFGHIGELRYEPTPKRVRAMLGDELVAYTNEALLIWEPRRIVGSYAVPQADLRAKLEPVGSSEPESVATVGLRLPSLTERPILDPSIPFSVHTAEGTAFDVVATGGTRSSAAFCPDDADLADYVVLDFDAFEWLEEDEPIVSHPRDPFHRIDVLSSSRHVRLELEGTVLAESNRAMFLFESLLPPRLYLPVEDVTAQLLPSDQVTVCAYKGRATHLSVDLPGGDAIAWTYHEPLDDALKVRDRVAFYDERLDLVLDGERRERPITPWSRR